MVGDSAAGAAMYERSGSESGTSLDTDSKSNENEAALVVAHVESLVRPSSHPCRGVLIDRQNRSQRLFPQNQ